MLSLVNATRPAAQNTRTPRTMMALRVRPNTRRDLIKRAFRACSDFDSLPNELDASTCFAQQELVAQKYRAIRDDGFARLKAAENLNPAVLPQADGHGPLDEMTAVGRDPHRHRAVALPNHAVFRHRKRSHGTSDADHEARIHSGSQQVLRVVDFGANQLSMRIRIEHRAQIGDMALEHLVGIGRHRDFNLLTELVGGSIGLDDICDHPHRRNISDLVWRRGVARLRQESGRGVAGYYSPADRAGYPERRFDLSIGEDLLDLLVCLAENAHRIFARLEIAFRGLLVRRRLIDVLLRGATGLHERSDPRQRFPLQFQDAFGREQRRFGLQEIGAVDREKNVTPLDVVANVIKCLQDFSWILRENLNEHVLVEVDRSDSSLQ